MNSSDSSAPRSSQNLMMITVGEKLFFMNHMARQWNLEPHHHQWLEMAIVVHGTALHRTTTGEVACKPGRVFVIPKGIWHAYSQSRDLELYNCQFSPELLDGPLAWVRKDPALGPLVRQDPWKMSSHVLTFQLDSAAVPKLRALAAALHRTAKTHGMARPGKLMAELLLLLDYIATKSKPAQPQKSPPVHSAVRRGAEMLQAELAREWTLPELAGQLRINPSYLVRLFRQATGRAPMKFLAEERAHKASQLLMTSEMNISEIGASVGWPEPKVFARCFRQHFGENATAFRRRLQTEN